ncbi:MAG: hypothetical protein IT516_12385 [Burkholderiales bacterium]|nr:hypothetical protein [Burkholderiales bacterium]
MASRRGGGRIDFQLVAAAALAALESLLAEWLPTGRREGHEYKALNPTRADSREGSFSINLNSGAWADFATDDKGGDPISLYAYLQGITQGEAARRLAERLGIADTSRAQRLRIDVPAAAPSGAEPTDTAGGAGPRLVSRTEWVPVMPIPASAGEIPKAHIKRGKPECFWEYRNGAGELLGIVYRFKTSAGGKEILPCVWARHLRSGAQEWRWLAFPDPRPLYGLDKLAGDGPVLVVEGEKCVDAARGVVPSSWSVVTWPSGARAVHKADWTPLRGRKIVVWPDCDAQCDKSGAMLPDAKQPGIRAAEEVAAILGKLACQVRVVRIPAPGAKPEGWDVADAIADGWTAAHVRQFIAANLREPARADGSIPLDQAAPLDAEWRKDLAYDDRGRLLAGVPNAFLVLTNRAEWAGVLAFDEFAQRPIKRFPPPYTRGVAGDWEAMDDSMTMMWLAQRAGMPKMSTAAAAEAAEMAARVASFDPVRAEFEALRWDGIDRLDHWLIDYFGAPDTPYVRMVGRMWLTGIAKRVFEPGCKFDYMPILEGPQGRGKSSALAILAGEAHFGNTVFVMGDKDSMAVIQGKLIYEIAELDSFNKADATRVKAFVTNQIDEFRPPYGRRVVRMPRRVVLVGTTNQYEYFKDNTGNRRFWPIKVIEQINLDGLAAARAQLLAEAVVRYRAGERCYPTREEQEEHFTPEQDAREIGDAWEDAIYRWLNTPHDIDGLPQAVSAYDVLVKALHVDAGKITKEMTIRVGFAMRKLGWHRMERRGQNPRYVYERPKKSAHDTATPDDIAGVPF